MPNTEKEPVNYAKRDGGHLVMQSGSTFHLTRAGAAVLGMEAGYRIMPSSPLVEELLKAAAAGKGKLNLKLQRLHHKAQLEAKGLGDAMPSAFAKPKQLPAGTRFEDQLAAQLPGFVSKGQAAQKAVDAVVLAAAPFPASKGAELMLLHMLVENPKNPRQDFGDVEELAKSIEASGGLLVPIVARPKDDVYEIVDGARRFRALQWLAKYHHSPVAEKALVDVRQLTDAQAFEAMMMADQRETLKPMEQARGYANMLTTGHTVDTIADQLGVSKGTVHGRLKLLELSEQAQRLFEWGVLTTAIATPLGRYPKELQDDALEEMLSDKNREGAGAANLWRRGEYENRYGGGSFHQREKKLNVGMAIKWLQEHFTKSLKGTPWDLEDERLPVPTELWPAAMPANDETKDWVIAPACKSCPKNSNNMPTEVAGENPHGRASVGFCTLPPCHEAKWKEALSQLRKQAKEKGDTKVLGEGAARAALKKLTKSDSRYAKLSDVNHADPKKRTYAQLLDVANKELDDGEQVRKVLAVADGDRAQLVDTDELAKVLAATPATKAWAKAPKKEPSSGSSAGYNYEAQRRRQEQERERVRAIRDEVLLKAGQQLRKEKVVRVDILQLLAESLGDYDSADLEQQVFEAKGKRELETFLEKKAGQQDLFVVLVIRGLANASHEEIEQLAGIVGYDVKKRDAELKAAQKAE